MSPSIIEAWAVMGVRTGAASRHHAEDDARRRFAVIPGYGGPPSDTWRPPVNSAQLGLLIFIAFELMVFMALITAYVVLRSSSVAWPPPNLPRLPLAITWMNTIVLTLSALTMRRAVTAIRIGSDAGLRTALLATAVLGLGFLGVQGSEWARLVHQGLKLSSGSFGSIFYTLIGLHGVHVLGAVIWLLTVLALTWRERFVTRRQMAVTLCAMYWYFVCGLWLVLFGLVYLS